MSVHSKKDVPTVTPTVNKVILESIPIDRKVKKYWVNKYKRIAQNCGLKEAEAKFKHLRVVLMDYIADYNRKSKLEEYLKSSGFRSNGMLRVLFNYADCQPHCVLSFLKLYTSPKKSQETADQAAWATKQRLDSVCSSDSIPSKLEAWFAILALPLKMKRKYYWLLQMPHMTSVYGSRFARTHSEEEWMAYWSRWYTLLKRAWKSDLEPDFKLVFPEIYKDYDVKETESSSYSQDFADLCSMHMTLEESPLTSDELEFVDGFLSETMQDELYALLYGESFDYTGVFQSTSILSGLYVGHVHHIKKKGAGLELRDIAVPNRFIQMALTPGAGRLYEVLRTLPRDATFNQDRFDTKIQNRVNNPNLYQGSVDLSKATDNLPLSWGEFIISKLVEIFGDLSEEEMASLSLFSSVARANWEDQGYFIKWKVGQPLGSLTSFAVLGLTHNFVVESLALGRGLGHSPYTVLGDDIVILNKKLRKEYIADLTRRRIPLSLHKSYEGRLSEFAGKTYITNNIPFYTSDHNAITWNSLFDWQRMTGIRIPWNNLPRKIKRKINQLVVDSCGKEVTQRKFNGEKVASSAYEHAQAWLVHGRGTHQYDSTCLNFQAVFEYLEWIDEKEPIDPVYHTGITVVGNGHPVVLLNERFAEKNGYFQRFRPVELPQWYKDKVRPCATDIAIRLGLSSVLGEAVRPSIARPHGYPRNWKKSRVT